MTPWGRTAAVARGVGYLELFAAIELAHTQATAPVDAAGESANRPQETETRA